MATATGCSGSDAPDDAPVRTVVVTVTVQAPPAAPTAPAVDSVPSGAASLSSWTMPNLVGANLQDAQNAIQSLTDFEIALTTSHDESGAGRQQIVDRNWKVCSQNVAPGETITTSTRIDFGTVKLEERC
jgi:hypothetical protein